MPYYADNQTLNVKLDVERRQDDPVSSSRKRYKLSVVGSWEFNSLNGVEVFLGRRRTSGFGDSDFVKEMLSAFEDIASLEISEPQEPMSREEMLAKFTVSGDDADGDL